MKKRAFVFLSIFLAVINSYSQIISIQCFNQNDSIGIHLGKNNLILNGGFENTNCGFNSNWNSFCPKSAFYTCNIENWVCVGGGSAVYPHFYDTTFEFVVEGKRAPYFENLYTKVNSKVNNDTAPFLKENGCAIQNISTSFFSSIPSNYGGGEGLSLEQLVSNLVSGNMYILEFWAGGGFDSKNKTVEDGLFAVDIGFGNCYLKNKPTPLQTGIGTRFLIAFKATKSSHTIKFTNWLPHKSNCADLILDDVRLYSSEFLPKNISINPGHPQTDFICKDIVDVSLNTKTKQIVITFQEDQKNTSIKIKNSRGKEMFALNFTGRELFLDQGDLKTGVYFVQIMNGSNSLMSKKLEIKSK
ncbi:MAG: T9SS type A sorting domain-containing protein [Bacteroidota bacterium]